MPEPTGRDSRELPTAALLPGAEPSSAAADVEGSPCSVVDGVPVGWSEGKTKRLAHLQQRVPTAVVISLEDLIRSKEPVLIERLAGKGPVVVTSIGNDNAGERDTDDNLANVRTDMQRELDLTLNPGQAASIGLLIPGDWSGKKLYLGLRDAATDLVLHRSPDLPVDLIG